VRKSHLLPLIRPHLFSILRLRCGYPQPLGEQICGSPEGVSWSTILTKVDVVPITNFSVCSDRTQGARSLLYAAFEAAWCGASFRKISKLISESSMLKVSRRKSARNSLIVRTYELVFCNPTGRLCGTQVIQRYRATSEISSNTHQGFLCQGSLFTLIRLTDTLQHRYKVYLADMSWFNYLCARSLDIKQSNI